jgi:hypothetical protein
LASSARIAVYNCIYARVVMRIRYCWWCDRPFLGHGYRRWVVTGRSDRTFVGGAWVGGSTGRFRGLRLLCNPCVTAIDRANSYDPALDLPEETQKVTADIWPPGRVRAWNDVGAWAIVAMIFLPIAIALVSHYSVPLHAAQAVGRAWNPAPALHCTSTPTAPLCLH